MTNFLTCPEHVRSARLAQATVLLDTHTGQVSTLLGSAHHLWLALAVTGHVQVAAHSAGMDTEQADHLAVSLLTEGLLMATALPRPWDVVRVATASPSWGTQEVPAGLPPSASLPKAHLALAAAALFMVLLARQAGSRRRSFARLLTLVRAASRRSCPRARHQTVDHALHCVRRVARVLPCRVACLEESIAAVLVLTAIGQAVVWCHGVATDPLRLHAWLAIDGAPVAEPASTFRYTPLLQVPSVGQACSRKEFG